MRLSHKLNEELNRRLGLIAKEPVSDIGNTRLPRADTIIIIGLTILSLAIIYWIRGNGGLQ